MRATPSEVERGVKSTVRLKSAIFGEGADSLYEIGPYRELLGSTTAGLTTRVASGVEVRLDDGPLFEDVRASSGFVPTRITGAIEGNETPDDLWVAVAVNGRIAAVTRSFADDDGTRFAAQVPENALRDGFNRVELLAIGGTGSALRLTPIERAE